MRRQNKKLSSSRNERPRDMPRKQPRSSSTTWHRMIEYSTPPTLNNSLSFFSSFLFSPLSTLTPFPLSFFIFFPLNQNPSSLSLSLSLSRIYYSGLRILMAYSSSSSSSSSSSLFFSPNSLHFNSHFHLIHLFFNSPSYISSCNDF
ncbi:hypothetical protein RIF29_05923 [Crotalaria pallida]|uniref:Uncharacterized protein n=1 Tax=Crotalaria pallida TaxID=3830 RepID=A0AAN9J3C7_CROPI